MLMQCQKRLQRCAALLLPICDAFEQLVEYRRKHWHTLRACIGLMLGRSSAANAMYPLTILSD